jgi:hypothetical protein
MTDAKLLRDRAAKARRLALRASGAHRLRRSERLLARAAALEKAAGDAEAEDAAAPTTVHPFIGSAPETGTSGAAAPIEDDKKRS